MPTDEETAKIKADAKKRAQAQSEAVEAQDDHIAAFRQSEEEAAKPKGHAVEVDPTPAVDDAVEEYGPFDEPTVVTTPHGDFGVPYRKILFFTERTVFDSRINRMVPRLEPTHRLATPKEMAPVYARRAAKKKALQGA